MIGSALIDQSRDAQQESGETSEVVMSIGVRKCDRNHIFRPESGMRPKSRIRSVS
jgi:hypothetical protein